MILLARAACLDQFSAISNTDIPKDRTQASDLYERRTAFLDTAS